MIATGTQDDHSNVESASPGSQDSGRSAQSALGSKGFRPDIEGLRAVAVLAVVLFHADVPGLGAGYVGVDVFFVISGFLITGQLWREASTAGTVRLRSFYGARARRLLPASTTVGVVTMIGSALLLPPLQVQSVTLDGITSALYVSNYRFISSGVTYFGKQNLLSPSGRGSTVSPTSCSSCATPARRCIDGVPRRCAASRSPTPLHELGCRWVSTATTWLSWFADTVAAGTDHLGHRGDRPGEGTPVRQTCDFHVHIRYEWW